MMTKLVLAAFNALNNNYIYYLKNNSNLNLINIFSLIMDIKDLEKIIHDIYDELLDNNDGEVANYIPH